MKKLKLNQIPGHLPKIGARIATHPRGLRQQDPTVQRPERKCPANPRRGSQLNRPTKSQPNVDRHSGIGFKEGEDATD